MRMVRQRRTLLASQQPGYLRKISESRQRYGLLTVSMVALRLIITLKKHLVFMLGMSTVLLPVINLHDP